jgi:hypothetical protein
MTNRGETTMSKLTTVEQDGEYTGEEIGRVWIRTPTGWEWYGVGSVDLARYIIASARLATDPVSVCRKYCEEL